MQILILANHSGGLYDFRKDLISELKKYASVTVAVPHNDRWDELLHLADRVIELPIDRRGMNPLHDSKLFHQYRAILKEVKPDLVLTYTIKPNIYGGLACRMAHIPYAVNCYQGQYMVQYSWAELTTGSIDFAYFGTDAAADAYDF